MSKRLEGRVAIVTGAGRGIGRAIASRLASEGASVAITALHEETVAQTADEILNMGGRALPMVANVASEADTVRYVEQTVAEFGRLDIMVNNAGVVTHTPIVEMSVKDWNRIFEINVVGTFLGCREAAKRMVEQGEGGRIINGSSVGGRRGQALLSAYAASKFAVIGLTQALAAELAPHAITVNAYVPGNVTSTPMWDTIEVEFARATGVSRETVREHFISAAPLNRDGRPEEIAAAVAFLASDESSFITGESMVIDGGLLRF